MNMDLFRFLLLFFEANLPNETPNVWDFEITSPRYSPDEIHYHLELLKEAGYIKARFNSELTPIGENYDGQAFHRILEEGIVWSGNEILVERLSYDGHQFLEFIRDENVWNMYKDVAKDLGIESVEMAFPIITDILMNKVQKNKNSE